jgi:hypothetical protein
MHGAPVIQDYLETTLRDWTTGRAALIQRWIDEGKMAPSTLNICCTCSGPPPSITPISATRSKP